MASKRNVRDDLNRIAAIAIESALDDGTEKPKRRRMGAVKALVAGAALVGAARIAAKRAPSLPRMPSLPDLSDLGDRVRERLDEVWQEPEVRVDDALGDEEAEDYQDEEEPEDEDYEDEEPVDEEDEDYEDEEPVDEEDEDVEDEEPVDQEPEDEEPEDEEPEASEAPGVEVGGNGHAPVDPASLPPEPPTRRRSGKQRKSRSKE